MLEVAEAQKEVTVAFNIDTSGLVNTIEKRLSKSLSPQVGMLQFAAPGMVTDASKMLRLAAGLSYRGPAWAETHLD